MLGDHTQLQQTCILASNLLSADSHYILACQRRVQGSTNREGLSGRVLMQLRCWAGCRAQHPTAVLQCICQTYGNPYLYTLMDPAIAHLLLLQDQLEAGHPPLIHGTSL